MSLKISAVLCLALLLQTLPRSRGDCWLIEGDKGYVWLAICSQNQPPYETIPQHINSTVHDLRLDSNKLKAVYFNSLSRFGNLTDLNLTKNEISYIEEGAFSGQLNLQVLQLGYNKLTNLTEAMLRGLGRLQYLFVQHNLLEAVSPSAFWECPNLITLDLSSNRLARLDPAAFAGLGRLMVCELAGNPFHCECQLYGFLAWLESFNNLTRNYDRLQCESPREFAGYPLLGPRSGGRNAMTVLGAVCKDGFPASGVPTLSPDDRMGVYETSGGGGGMEDLDFLEPTALSGSDPSFSPSIRLQQVTFTMATLVVKIPSPFSKMYILVQYNSTYVSDVMNLRNRKEIIILDKLKPRTDYTFCVASIRNSQRYNHTCLSFTTRDRSPDDRLHSASTTTHYIMTILGCLFGMVLILGLVYYCLRKRRLQEEKQKSLSVKKTILEMRYGPEAAASVISNQASSIVQKLNQQHQHHQPKLASPAVSRLSSIPQAEKMGATFSEALSAAKGNYMDVRTENLEGLPVEEKEALNFQGRDGGLENGEESDEDQGSASEISTIAKEVDKVNQIINNCIDALKLDTAQCGLTSTPSKNAPVMLPPPAPLGLPERAGIGGGGFLSPPCREASRPLQRQLSADAAVVGRNRCSVSSGGSTKSARVFSLEIPERSPESKGSPTGEPIERLPLMGASSGGGQHLEVRPAFHCSEHRHSFPALFYEAPADSPAQRPSFLKPLSRSRRDAASYSQLSSSSRTHNYSGYSSSPEYSSESTLKIWERFRPYRKSPKEEAAGYVTAGHALRKKVQFAKDEDLHDILDYWKGVSAQQNL
ncbi:UNVERIFIED_CONTAM: hypothetical protein FKN15_046233 [Acipenser sinensis]